MKSMKKAVAMFLSVTTALSMPTAMSMVSAAEPATTTTTTTTGTSKAVTNTFEKVVEIKSVASTANAANVATSNFLEGVDYYGATFTTEDGEEHTIGEAGSTLITVTKDGKEITPAAGTFTAGDNVTITVSGYLTDTNLGSWSGLQKFGYRAGLVIDKGVATADSVLSAITGTADNTGIANAEVTAETSGFSALINLASEASITDSKITLDTDSNGQDVNDFAGYGAAVATYGTGEEDAATKTTIKNSTIETTGVAKLATFVDNGADLVVENSTLKTNGGEIYGAYKSTANQSYMINPPWVLGISGSVRTTNVMGQTSTGTYVDSTIESANWGAISTDTGSYMNVTAINDDIVVDGSGYGAYAIGDKTEETYYGSNFEVNTYAIIMTGSDATLTSYTGGDEVTVKNLKDGSDVTTVSSSKVKKGKTIRSSVTSTGYGFMFHANGSDNVNNLTLEKGTEVTTGKTTFLLKKVNNNVTLDNAKVSAANGVVLQLMDNDDDMIGASMDEVFGMPTFNNSLTEGEGWSDTWTGANTKDHYQNTFNVTNTALKGNIYNATGYTRSNPGADLTITLGSGASLAGAITESAFQHTYKTFTYRGDAYDIDTASEAASKLGDVQNKPAANTNSKINVVLTDNAVWTAAKASSDKVYADEAGTSVVADAATYTDLYIDSLAISDDAKVIVPAGITLHVGDQTYGNESSAVIITAEDSYTVVSSTPSISVSDKTVTYGKDYELNVRTASKGAITYNYYTDANCTKKLAAAPVNAGTYYVTATVAADGQYKAATSKAAKLTITKAASTVTLSAKTVTYNGKVQAIGAAKVTGSTGKVTYSYYKDAACKTAVKASSVKNAGTYYVKASVAATTNYQAASSKVVKLTIAKAAPTAKLTKTTYTYTGKKLSLKMSKTSGAGKVSYTYYNSKNKKVSASTALKKVGSYKVKVTFKGSTNYKAKTVTLSYKIKK